MITSPWLIQYGAYLLMSLMVAMDTVMDARIDRKQTRPATVRVAVTNLNESPPLFSMPFVW